MRVAWFRPAPRSPLLDDTAQLLAELSPTVEVELFDEQRAPDFVWMEFRRPFDLCVFEIGESPAHGYVRAYAPHYPGLLRLRTTSAVAPLLGRARAAVLADAYLATPLAHAHPATAVRVAPLGAAAVPPALAPGPRDRGAGAIVAGLLDTGLLDASRVALVERAAARAREGGVDITLRTGDPAAVLAGADVVVAVEWPPRCEAPADALLAMSAGLPVIALETEATAAWPALDPQNWHPREGTGGAAPIAVTIDPRDEEHSLLLALRRLAAEPPLRRALGGAAQAWIAAHATPAAAARAWLAILTEAAALPPVSNAANAPSDGTEFGRQVLHDFGVEWDRLLARSQ